MGYSNDYSNNITLLNKPSIVHNPPIPVVGEQPQPQQRRPIKSKVDSYDDVQNQFLNNLRASVEANLK
ncbi:hypothetical protein LINPERHAP1_LOCUS8278, partial [Linum perenne]